MQRIRGGLIFLTFIFAALSSWAQEQSKEQARQYFEMASEIMAGTKAIDDARELMVIAANYDTTNLKANTDAGIMHLRTIQKEQSVKYLMRVFRQNPNFRFDLEFQIASGYHFGLYFDKAIDFYTRYKTKLDRNPNYKGKDRVDAKEVVKRLEECATGKELLANPKPFSITNLGPEINSEFDDYAPVVNAAESELIFTTRRRDGNLNENVGEDNKPFEDIFVSKKEGGNWQPAKNIGPVVNTRFNDSNIALSPNGNILFLYKDGVGDGDIFSSTKQPDSTWAKPVAFPGSINSSFYESSISITKDESTIYFASERPGGLGGIDIYSCTKDKKGGWTLVKNLGPMINTEYDEDAPFIDYDGKTLYFSSRGRKGMGGFDIFKTTLIDLEKKEWTEPENVGYPINTPDDDVFIVGTGTPNRFYFSSARADGYGYSDIYLISDLKKEPEVAKNPEKKGIQPIRFIVEVVDATTKEPIDAVAKMRGKDNTIIGSASLGTGSYEFGVMSTVPKEYVVSVELEGYIFENLKVNLGRATEESQTITRRVLLRKVAVGEISALRHVFFDFGKATLQEASSEELNMMVTMMKQNQSMQVEIGGHTDDVGSDTFNKKLSQQRADAVKNYLTSNGIGGRRIKSIGYGEEKPLVSNDDESGGREINRRVEFKILAK
ncbi:MAG: OmpA family protein [Cyclobacteriaceae bacterium]|nr:OmpA family protein [Cyclobacteriaceae bacterium]